MSALESKRSERGIEREQMGGRGCLQPGPPGADGGRFDLGAGVVSFRSLKRCLRAPDHLPRCSGTLKGRTVERSGIGWCGGGGRRWI
jgi:hypothetical protein